MSLLYFFRRLFSLDTLDTRFTVSAKAPLQQSGEEHAVDSTKPAATARSETSPPSLWNTPEYYCYIAFVSFIVPVMVYVPYTVSKESDPEYPKFAPLLSDGWIPGRKVDNSDAQYASFRDNVPYMALLILVHPLLRELYNHFFAVQPAVDYRSKGEGARAELRLNRRVSFDLVFSVVFMVALHGLSALKILLILNANYSLATKLPKRYIPLATWAFNVAILFANELSHGYQFVSIARFLTPNNLYWGQWLDSFGGLIPRWEVMFKITILRLISFNMDYYWSLESTTPAEKQPDPSLLSERERISMPASVDSYSLTNYLSYVLYGPLYLAGPIVTFNDYIFQLRYPSPSITRPRITLYGIRFLVSLLTMELILHYIYAVAISKSNPTWSHYTPFQLSMLGFFNLHIIWLKLLLPWRFFRLWALVDNIDPPENMVRCMSNNYSAVSFWRAWHRSFNKWIIRYIYIPLGGSGRGTSKARSMLNMAVAFTFVALWHDISLTLLAWSWLIILFLVPEIICTTVLFPAKNYTSKPTTYRILSGFGAVGNIVMMMAANLVGFAIGWEGLVGLARGIVTGFWGWVFMFGAAFTLFNGAMIMFEVRAAERRKGIDLKC